jgi:hypothetical protein
MSFNAWTLMLGVIGLLLNSVGLAFVATQIALARGQAARARTSEDAELALRRKESTVSFMVSTMKQKRSIWRQLPDDFNENAIATFVQEITIRKRNQQREVDLKGYLTMMETLATGVSIGIYDLPTVEQNDGGAHCLHCATISILHRSPKARDRRQHPIRRDRVAWPRA